MINIQYTRGHFKALDGIRGCAILLVLLFHCLKTSFFPFSVITGIGWIGVDLFFVLSGFLITGILYDTKGSKNYLTVFIFKRILRIFPLYYLALSIFFLALLIPNITSSNHFLHKGHFNDILYYLTYTQNIHFSLHGWGITDILNHFWSLAIEEQFYMVWPLVIMFSKRNKIILISIFLIGIALLTRNLFPDGPFSYVFTLARIDALAIGSIASILIRRNIAFLNKYTLSVFMFSLAVLSTIVIYTQSVGIGNMHFIRYGYTLFAVLFASIIILTFDSKRIGKVTSRFFENSFLRFLGKYSYGIYVYHWLLYRGLYMYLETKYSLSIIFILPFIFFVFIVSVLSYNLYEKKFLKYKSKIDQNTNWKELLFPTINKRH
jgi:peptidoglycan/LPS O-acetylase OafA/YrhL